MSAVSCWNCGQTLPDGTARCPSCGVPQDRRPAAPATGGTPVTGVAPAVGALPGATRAVARDASPLGPEFAGNPAAVGARLAAFTIDVVAVAVVGVAVAILTRSAVLTALAVVELAVGLLVLQARTGLGLGNALLRLRVSRSDAPFSPGLGRAFVRSFLTGAGSLVLGVGAWVVEASSAWDRGARRRSWADRAAGTVVVAVPRRVTTESAAPAAPSIVAPPLPGGVSFDLSEQVTVLPGAAPAIAPAPPAAPAAPSAPVLAPPQVIPSRDVRGVVGDTGRSSDTGTGTGTGTGTPGAPGPVPVEAAGGVVGGETGGELLLIFDTGQREQLPVPVAVNLGRAPAGSEPGDRLVVVRDPEHTVSKTHARLEHSFSGTWITDGGSTNGTELLDETGASRRLEPGVRTLVEDGVRVQLGNRVFTISRLLGGAS
ncbi:RDD family protein [Leifsonia aquatica]|uniref:RDD family protein n=1 Tax=Leifsonia aquatica TaxID=144185 RepID=UPI0038213EE0